MVYNVPNYNYIIVTANQFCQLVDSSLHNNSSPRLVGQGHMHHEAPLIIIILNVVSLPFDDDTYIIHKQLNMIVL